MKILTREKMGWLDPLEYLGLRESQEEEGLMDIMERGGCQVSL